MFIRSFLILFLLCSTAHAKALVRMPTQEQIDKLCVPVVLTIDNQVHYFYYKHVKYLGDNGIDIVYGKGLNKINHFDKEEIVNYEEALRIYQDLKERQP